MRNAIPVAVLTHPGSHLAHRVRRSPLLEAHVCRTATEVRSRSTAGTPVAAVLVDEGHAGADRDLLVDLRAAGLPVLVVGDLADAERWLALGAVAVLPRDFEEDSVGAVLHRGTWPIRAEPSHHGGARAAPPTGGRLVAVLGASGAGSSSVAIALAQSLADRAVRGHGPVILLDLARHGHQAVLHRVDRQPGAATLLDVLDRYRSRTPPPSEVVPLLTPIPARGYLLLTGLRSHHDWIGVRPASLRAAIEGFCSASHVVVADVDPDLEGEADTGSLDIEDRNALARAAAARADLVVVVTSPSATALHDLGSVLEDVADMGVRPARTVIVVNRSPRSSGSRRRIVRDIDQVRRRSLSDPPPAMLVHLHATRLARADSGVRRLPRAITRPLAVVGHLLDHIPPREWVDVEHQSVRVVPGHLGHHAT